MSATGTTAALPRPSGHRRSAWRRSWDNAQIGGTINSLGQDSQRRTRTATRLPALALAVAIALGAGFAVVVHAADARLDEADQALQKAEALLLSSSAAGTSPKVQKEFDRNAGRAVDLINRARAHVKTAKDAVDEELGLASAPQQAGAEAMP